MDELNFKRIGRLSGRMLVFYTGGVGSSSGWRIRLDTTSKVQFASGHCIFATRACVANPIVFGPAIQYRKIKSPLD